MIACFRVLGVLVLMSLIQSTSFCLSIGRDPKDLPISVVNDESNCTEPGDSLWHGRCANGTQISCIYIDMLSKKDIIIVSVICHGKNRLS